MKMFNRILLATVLSGAPLLAVAATPAPTAQTASAPKSGVQDQAQLEKQLEDARKQLQDAARRVAELSMQLNGDAMDRFTIMRDKMDKMQRRGILGVDLDEDDQNSKSPGAVLSGVTPGGPADKAGLRSGDVITAINGTEFKPSGDDTAADKLVDFMHGVKPGDSLKVSYTRGGKASTATVTAGSLRDMGFAFYLSGVPTPPTPPMAPMPPEPPMPPMPPASPMPRMFGFNTFFSMGHPGGDMQLVTLTPGLAPYFSTDKGLLVLHVERQSPLQLQDGDVILTIGGRDPGTPPHAMRILGSYGPGETVKIDIMRKGKAQTVNVTLPKERDDSDSNAFNYKTPDPEADDDGDDGR
ncbi:MAG: PDZ domain-containing protein [Bacillota bacterium]